MKDKMEIFKKSFDAVVNSEDFIPYTISNMDMLLETNHIMNGQEVELCRKFLNEFDKMSL